MCILFLVNLLYDFLVMPCALTQVFPQLGKKNVWIAKLLAWWHKALCCPFWIKCIRSSAPSRAPSGMFFCRRHIIQVARSTVTRPFYFFSAVQRSPWHSCGNHCFMSTRALKQRKKNLKRLVVCLAFCCCCFCFYCRGGIHGGVMNRGPVSDGLQCPRCTSGQGALLGIAHKLRNSAASRPPDVWVCFLFFYSLFFPPLSWVFVTLILGQDQYLFLRPDKNM